MGTIKDYLNTAQTAVSDNIEARKEFSAQDDAYKSVSSGSFIDKAKNFRLFKVSRNNTYDDNIEIKAGSKTLLGDDFSSLYASSETETISSASGSSDSGQSQVSTDIIKSDSPYTTEMHSGDLRSGNWSEYSVLPVNQKAEYEVALLTKKYSAMEGSDENAKAYADKMAQYRQFCDSNGVDWNSVIYSVSGEFQTEVADYKASASDFSISNATNTFSGSADKDRAQAAAAHKMLLSCAPDGYTDELLPALSGKVTYEDTVDDTYTEANESKSAIFGSAFFSTVASFFKTVYEHLPHPVKWLKNVFTNTTTDAKSYVDHIDTLSEDFDKTSASDLQEGQEVADQLNGIKQDVSDSAVGQAAGTAADAAEDETQQIFADPSQEIQDGRNWASEKINEAKPYVDAAGNAAKSAVQTGREKADEFVQKWGNSDASDTDEMQP